MAEQETKTRAAAKADADKPAERVATPDQAPGATSLTTTLDDHLDMPSSAAPGDGPYDTVDPTEHASSATPDKAAAAQAGFGVVNAVVPIPAPDGSDRKPASEAEERYEEYTTPGPTGDWVKVRRNMDTGESEVIGKADRPE